MLLKAVADEVCWPSVPVGGWVRTPTLSVFHWARRPVTWPLFKVGAQLLSLVLVSLDPKSSSKTWPRLGSVQNVAHAAIYHSRADCLICCHLCFVWITDLIELITVEKTPCGIKSLFLLKPHVTEVLKTRLFLFKILPRELNNPHLYFATCLPGIGNWDLTCSMKSVYVHLPIGMRW